VFFKSDCHICGAELLEPRERHLGVCRATKCQIAWAGQLQTLRKKELLRKRQERTGIAEAHRDRIARRLRQGELREVQPAIVPANLRKIVKLPQRRKRDFRDHLKKIISQALDCRTNRPDPLHGETAADSSPPPPELASLFGRGCATCRGRCCNGGGIHAYLSVETMLGYMSSHPQQSPEEVLKAYASYLPEKSYRDSCVFHTDGGCALPREMRGKISGDFYCEELRQIRDQYYSNGEKTYMFYAFEENTIVRKEPYFKPSGD
jgi:hypothetical protein